MLICLYSFVCLVTKFFYYYYFAAGHPSPCLLDPSNAEKARKQRGFIVGKSVRTRPIEATKPPGKSVVAYNLKSIGCNLQWKKHCGGAWDNIKENQAQAGGLMSWHFHFRRCLSSLNSRLTLPENARREVRNSNREKEITRFHKQIRALEGIKPFELNKSSGRSRGAASPSRGSWRPLGHVFRPAFLL